MLRKLSLVERNDLAARVEHDRARAGRPLIERDDHAYSAIGACRRKRLGRAAKQLGQANHRTPSARKPSGYVQSEIVLLYGHSSC